MLEPRVLLVTPRALVLQPARALGINGLRAGAGAPGDAERLGAVVEPE